MVLMAVTALMWSSAGLAIKLVDWNPMAITGVRSALAAAMLGVLSRGRLAASVSYAGLLYMGILQQGVSLALYTWAIRRLGALEAILILMLEPIINPVLVAVGYGELPGAWALIGGALVLAAVTLRGVTGFIHR